MTAYDSYFDRFFTLTRKDYYYGAVRGSDRKLKTWEKKMQPINEELSEFSLRSATRVQAVISVISSSPNSTGMIWGVDCLGRPVPQDRLALPRAHLIDPAAH